MSMREVSKFKKIFGVGPKGVLLSLLLLVLFAGLNARLGYPPMFPQPFPARIAGIILIVAGLSLHFWTGWTLRHWWLEGQLCLLGPFKWFRHPMYAAWISFVAVGSALCLNSWVLLLWAVMLHPLWHMLVGAEEALLQELFPQRYRDYAARTGRFLPRWRKSKATGVKDESA